MMYRTGAPPAPDAEQRCLYCGAPSAESQGFCSCGAQLPARLPEEPIGPFVCPRCPGEELAFTPFDPKQYGRHCKTCGGLFIGAHQWTELIGTSSEVEVAIIDTSDAAPLSRTQKFPFATCPACRATMDRATFAARSGIAVDVCNLHGIWFDAGELYEVVHWVCGGRPDVDMALPPVMLTFRSSDPRQDNGNDVYARLVNAGALFQLRRIIPWR